MDEIKEIAGVLVTLAVVVGGTIAVKLVLDFTVLHLPEGARKFLDRYL